MDVVVVVGWTRRTQNNSTSSSSLLLAAAAVASALCSSPVHCTCRQMWCSSCPYALISHEYPPYVRYSTVRYLTTMHRGARHLAHRTSDRPRLFSEFFAAPQIFRCSSLSYVHSPSPLAHVRSTCCRPSTLSGEYSAAPSMSSSLPGYAPSHPLRPDGALVQRPFCHGRLCRCASDHQCSAPTAPPSCLRSVPSPPLDRLVTSFSSFSMPLWHACTDPRSRMTVCPPAGRCDLSCLPPLSATCCPRPCPWHLSRTADPRKPARPLPATDVLDALEGHAMHGRCTGVREMWPVQSCCPRSQVLARRAGYRPFPGESRRQVNSSRSDVVLSIRDLSVTRICLLALPPPCLSQHRVDSNCTAHPSVPLQSGMNGAPCSPVMLHRLMVRCSVLYPRNLLQYL
ncbi:hypothetical protein OH77DRAFT_1146629 [Trametes cingulata]|nr:hypothetical protein OH77DRAFT_1146629 [Trametes cingulata]